MTAKDLAYRKISDLVTRFDEQYLSYKKSEYNETLTRRDFIDPFFKSLGWDIDNEQGYAEAYREVIHEDRVKVSGATKAPDYSFRLPGGKRLFFVEAKKPSVQVKDEIHPSYQVRRYGWSAKLPVSIITDFEEFSVYDCTKRPNPTDRASVARINYLVYKDYAKDFDFIWDTFSKEHVLKGSFDKFVQGEKNKKGTTTVDKEFLQSLDSWRTQLAIAISKSNRNLDEDELNYVVQNTIDRIIFLRIAEDRGIEEYGYLKNSLEGENYYENLFRTFVRADEKYNSGLFDFKKDKISRELAIDNKTIKKIISELYFPDSPYEFSVLPVEILGNAYEQFLGKVIRIDKSHKAKIEEKPEVRKAGGVYYTPQYIVDYIVKNTVGKLVEGKTPKEVSKLKIVDPACGSGSFLLGAYQYLLDWHKEYYSKSAPLSFRRGAGGEVITPAGNLATFEKKRILLNNIYGVDIDANAVEVTKLSLLLKCLEGETSATIEHQLSMFNERVLPTLDNNIKVGNSLIDTDFYSNQLDFGEEKKIKPFNWQKAFPDVFKQGGFDAVIGNPPYRLMQPKDIDINILSYFKEKYESTDFKIDLFHLFFQIGVKILSENSFLGFISPSSLLNNVYAENLRCWLMTNTLIRKIAITKEKVFLDAEVYTAVFILEKPSNLNKVDNNLVKTTTHLEYEKVGLKIDYSNILQNRFQNLHGKVWNILINEENINLIEKIAKQSLKLSDVCIINRGLITGDKGKYFSKSKLDDRYKPILAGGDVNRYYVNSSSNFVLFERPKSSGGCWDPEVHFSPSKILVRQIGVAPIATHIDKPIAVTGNVFTIRGNSVEEEKLILGILNSSLINWYWQIMFQDFKNSFPQITIFSLSSIPIKSVDPKSVSKTSLENQIVSLVNQLLFECNQRQLTKIDSNHNHIQSKIDYCEARINHLVYELYGLTEEEVRIVESDLIF